MAINLNTSYPGKVTVDGNNPNGTFKNRTSDVLKDGTPYEKKWSSDVWGFLSHILGLASVSPSGAEENETNSQYYDALDGLLGRRKVEFETSRDLVFNFDNSTQATATFSRMSLLDSDFIPKFLTDKSLTWDIESAGVLEPGTSEKASHIYGCWVDSDENLVMAPDLTGTADSFISGKLADSAATFLTDLVHAGDIVYNLDDLTKTTAASDSVAEGLVVLNDNIFPLGSENYKIVKMSPVGLGDNRERLGSVSNNSGSDLDDSFYTQIQKEKDYTGGEPGDGKEFDVTSDPAITSLTRAKAYIRQTNDWTGKGTWKINFNVAFNVASAARTRCIMTILGVTNKNIANFAQAIATNQQASEIGTSGYADSNTSQYRSLHQTDTTSRYAFSGDVECDKKPDFHN